MHWCSLGADVRIGDAFSACNQPQVGNTSVGRMQATKRALHPCPIDMLSVCVSIF